MELVTAVQLGLHKVPALRIENDPKVQKEKLLIKEVSFGIEGNRLTSELKN
jgi:hypothetical protein